MTAFSPDTAAAWLGRPDAHVTRWYAFPTLPGLFECTLEGPGLVPTAFVVATRGGEPVAERGSAAVVRFLRDGEHLDRDLALDDVVGLFQALEGWPAGFGPASAWAPPDEPGPYTLRTRPFAFAIHALRVGPASTGAPARVRERATLAADAVGRLAWTIAQLETAGWRDVARLDPT